MSSSTLRILLLFLFFLPVYAELKVTTDLSPITAKRGSTVLLGCHFSVSPETVDFGRLVVQWILRGQVVAAFDDTEIYNRPGAKLSVERLRKGDASLSLTDVTPKDEGEYTCDVLYSPQREHSVITLKVEGSSAPEVQSRAPEVQSRAPEVQRRTPEVQSRRPGGRGGNTGQRNAAGTLYLWSCWCWYLSFIYLGSD